MSRMPTLAALGLAAALAVAGGCGGDPEAGVAVDEALAPLRAEVAALRDSLSRRLDADSLARTVLKDPGQVTVGIGVPFISRLLVAGTRAYLDDLHLHLRPDVVVREEDRVRVSLGPIRITAGRWTVRVRIESIEARIAVDTVELTVADSSRLDIAVPVHVREGSGRARVDFDWDASTAASVVCRDFRVRDTFEGTVSPRTYRLEASLVLVPEAGGIVARPEYTGRRLSVQPEPTEESWRRVRELLDRQNNIFRCGLGLQPDRMEELLRRQLREGFRFEFPESILRPIPLPTSIHESVRVGERSYVLGLHAATLRLDPERLWYSTRVEVTEGAGRAPDAAGGPGRPPPQPESGPPGTPSAPDSSTPM